MYKKFPLIVVIGYYILLQTEGCGRTPSRPNPPTTTPFFSENTTALPINHRLPCTENETLETACLNGGTCFAAYVDGRTIQCACPKRYVGDRCQMIDPTIIFGIEDDSDKVTKAGLAAGLTALILFLTVLIFILIWHRRYKRKREREKAKKESELLALTNGDLNNGNYKPPISGSSRSRDSYVESIPLTSLPLNQSNEIQKDEEMSLKSEGSDTQKLLISSIPYADEEDGSPVTSV